MDQSNSSCYSSFEFAILLSGTKPCSVFYWQPRLAPPHPQHSSVRLSPPLRHPALLQPPPPPEPAWKLVHSLPFATVKVDELSGSKPVEVLKLGMQLKSRISVLLRLELLTS